VNVPGFFVFAIHFHQPTGQLKKIHERVFENSYKLLTDVFKEFSDLKFTIHVSGPLLLYASEHYPDWVSELAKLADYGVAEILGGSLGEAILPILPSGDRDLQLREYARLVERLLGVKPRGMWLPERVWEPDLVGYLARNGVEYVLVDDSTLSRTGRGGNDSLYPWLTEDSGYSVKVFFIDTALRYILPWEPPERVVGYMRERVGGLENPVLVWGSDAEKFGEWRDPGWARWWLHGFLNYMRVEKSIQMVHPYEYLKEHGVRGLIYLPPGSYDKMLEWSGGFFRNFIVKYAEVNNMHKKMLWVRRKLSKAGEGVEDAWRSYLLAQCNDAYWHGLFGGVYLAHLRQAIYENYIRAERIAEEALGYYRGGEAKILLEDFDYDGLDELIVEREGYNLYIDLADGGSIFEFDVKKKGLEHNLQDTMSRYKEPYLEEAWFKPDWYRRVSGRVHLWSTDTGLDDWLWNTPFRDLSDLALARFNLAYLDKEYLGLKSEGGFYVFGSKIADIEVEKRMRLLENGFAVDYAVRNVRGGSVRARVGFEYHLAPKFDRYGDREVHYKVGGELRGLREKFMGVGRSVELVSEFYPAVEVSSNRELNIWVAPLSTVARTEKGLLEMLQGVGVQFLDDVELAPGSEVKVSVETRVKW
jgi:hypothetical protein